MTYDCFISHAGEDKERFVRHLATGLRARGLAVWYDEFSLDVGDSLRESIDRGLADSKYAIVVLSPAFLSKQWPTWELNGLVARQNAEGRTLILPVWHEIELSEILAWSPPIANIVALNSSEALGSLVSKLAAKIRPAHRVGEITIPGRFERGMPVLDVEIWIEDEEPEHCVAVVDYASDGCLIGKHGAERLGIEITSVATAIGASGKFIDFATSEVYVRLSGAMQPILLEVQHVSAQMLNGFELVLGQDLLSAFQVTINGPAGSVELKTVMSHD